MLIKNMLFALIKKCKVLFLAMCFVSALGITMSGSFISSSYSFESNAETFINDYGLPDVDILLNEPMEKTKTLTYLQNVDGIDAVEMRYQLFANLKVNDRPITLNVKTYRDDSFIKFYTHAKNNSPVGITDIIVNRTFADNNHLVIGDVITLTVPVIDINLPFHIARIVSTPETIFYQLNEMGITDKYYFGYSYVSAEAFAEAIPRIDELANEVVIKTKSGYDRAKIRNAIVKKMQDDNVAISYSFERENSPTVLYLERITTQMWQVSFIVPAIFLAITFILIFLFLIQIIRGLLKEIGIMNALGITKKEITLLLFSFTNTMVAISSIFGIAFSFILTRILHNMFAINYCVPLGSGLPNAGVLAIIIAVLLVICSASVLVTMFMIRKVSPKDAIANNAGQFKPLPGFINRIVNKRSTLFKLNANMIHKNFMSVIVSIIVIAFSYITIYGAVNYYQSSDFLISQLSERYQYDSQVFNLYRTKDEKERENFINTIASLHAVKDYNPFSMCKVDISFNNNVQNVTICGVKENRRELIKIPDAKHKDCEVKKDSIILEELTAKKLGVKIGEKITIGRFSFVVNAISSQAFSKQQYMEYDTFINTMKDISVDGSILDTVLVNVYNEIDFLNQLSKVDLSIYNIFTSRYVSTITAGIKTVQLAAVVIAGFAIIIGFAVILIMGRASLAEQTRKLSILRTLGFKHKEMSLLVLIQYAIFFVVGIIIAIPSGIFFAKFLLNVGSSNVMTMYFTNSWWIYLFALVLIIIYILIAHLCTSITMKRWNIVENIKTRE